MFSALRGCINKPVLPLNAQTIVRTKTRKEDKGYRLDPPEKVTAHQSPLWIGYNLQIIMRGIVDTHKKTR